ncbi:hypothetical protein Tco_0928483 [Tanacetum coccineum]
MIRLRAEAASTSHSLPLPPPLPISVPTSSPPLLLPSASRREDRPEVTLPPQKRLGIALGPRYEVGESSSAAAARPAGGLRADYGFVATIDREIRRDLEREVGYGITDSWDEIVETLQGAPTEMRFNDVRHEQSQRHYWLVSSKCFFSDTTSTCKYTTLDETELITERLGGDRWMRVNLAASRLCHLRTYRNWVNVRGLESCMLLNAETSCDFRDAKGRP